MANKTKEVGIRLSVKEKDVAIRALQQFGKEGQSALAAIEKAGRPASDGLKLVNEGAKGAKDALRGVAGEAGTLGRMLSRGGLLGLGIAALVGGLAMLSNRVVSVSRELRQIEEEARRSGLGIEAFQEVTYAAQQLNVSQDAVKDGFRELSIRASEFAATGGGSAAEAFRQIGFTQAQIRDGLRDTDKLFSDIITRLREFGEADRIRFADEIFGGQGGEQFVAFVDAGAAAIARYREEAQSLGIVLKQDVFERAREVEAKFATVARVIDTQLKSAFMDLAPVVVEVGNAIVFAASVVRDIADAIAYMRGEMEAISTRNLENRLTLIGGQRAQLESQRLDLQGRWAAYKDQSLAIIDDGIAAIAEEERQILDILNRRDNASANPSTPPKTPPKVVSSSTDELARQAEQLIRRLRTASEEYASTMATLNAMLSRGLIDQETYNRAVAEAILKRAEAVETEADYAEALALVEQARADGIIGERAYTDAVEEMTRRRLEAQNDWAAGFQLGIMRVVEQNRDFASQVGDAWVSAFSGAEDAIISLVQTGKADVKDLANSIIADLLRISIRQGITGPIASFIGGLFGGGGLGKAGGTMLSLPQAHSGWVVARGNPPARAALAGLDRYHIGGLNPRERMIVAQEGEGIFTPRQMDNADALFRSMVRSLEAMMSRQSGSGQTRFEVHNYTGAPVQQEQRKDSNGVNVERLIVGTVNRGLAQGDFDNTLRAGFGLNRKGH